MRQRVISLRGYVTSNVGAQKKKLPPAGIEPGTQRLPAQTNQLDHPHTGAKAPACGMKPSGGYGLTWGFLAGVKSNGGGGVLKFDQ